MNSKKTYVALGGNIGDTINLFKNAFELIQENQNHSQFSKSRIYWTTPVSSIPQAPFFNAVCCFNTTLDPLSLLKSLQSIECLLGKTKKEKFSPRPIDLDILFYGTENFNNPDLIIPHTQWKNRLFVLVPLADLTSTIKVKGDPDDQLLEFNVLELLKSFPNIHQETVLLWKE